MSKAIVLLSIFLLLPVLAGFVFGEQNQDLLSLDGKRLQVTGGPIYKGDFNTKEHTLEYYCVKDYLYYHHFPYDSTTHYAQRFTSYGGEDTLLEIGVAMMDVTAIGSPDLRLQVWGDLNGRPDPSSILYDVTIPFASIQPYFTLTTHTVAGLVLVPGEFHISTSLINDSPGDRLSVLSDDGYCGEGRSSVGYAWDDWYSFEDEKNSDVNLVMFARLGFDYSGKQWFVSTTGDNVSGDGTRNDPYATIQYAVDNATEGDTVVIMKGTHFGVDNRNINPLGKNLVIRGDIGPDVTYIDVGDPGNYGFIFENGENSGTIIEDLLIMNAAGGIKIDETSPILRNVHMFYCDTGLINNQIDGSSNLINCGFYDNTLGLFSVGNDYNACIIDSSVFESSPAALKGDFFIKNSTIKNNTNGLVSEDPSVTQYRYRADSCIIKENTGTVIEVGYISIFNDCKIQNNTANYIVYCSYISVAAAHPEFNNCQIDNNDCANGMLFDGPGIWLNLSNTRYSYNNGGINYITGDAGDVSIDSCTFTHNNSTALSVASAGITNILVSNSLFADNTADGLYLGMAVGFSLLYDNTFVNNINGIQVNSSGDFFLERNLLAYNENGFLVEGSISGAFNPVCNDAYGNTVANYSGITDPTGSNSNISAEPMFCSIASGDYHIDASSPCAPALSPCGWQIGALDANCDVLRPLIITLYSDNPVKSDCPSYVNLMVTDPEGFYIGRDGFDVGQQTLFPADYVEEPPDCNDEVTIHYPIEGEYLIEVLSIYGGEQGGTYTIGVQIDGSLECIQVEGHLWPPSGQSDSYHYEVDDGYHYLNGDADGNDALNILDITYLIAFLYSEGPIPEPELSGDVDCNLTVNILDITYLIDFLYQEGLEPCYFE